jgi:hypothetical protein
MGDYDAKEGRKEGGKEGREEGREGGSITERKEGGSLRERGEGGEGGGDMVGQCGRLVMAMGNGRVQLK